MVEPRTEKQIRVRDGRRVGIAEYGAPDGPPVLYCHGFPGSRLDWRLMDPEDAAASRARILAPDRPGYGLSDAAPRRTISAWTSDVADLATALGIERFAVLGVSGGGPFALACASALARQVTAAAVVCGMGPPDAPGMSDGVSWTIPGKPALMRRLLLSLMAMGLRKDPEQFVERSKGSFAQVDADLLDDPEVAEAYVAALQEAFRRGVGGAAAEAGLYRSSWGFRLDDIGVPVHLWHGELDENVPISVGRYLANALPTCRARFVEDEGHLTLPRTRMAEVLDDLLSGSQLP